GGTVSALPRRSREVHVSANGGRVLVSIVSGEHEHPPDLDTLRRALLGLAHDLVDQCVDADGIAGSRRGGAEDHCRQRQECHSPHGSTLQCRNAVAYPLAMLTSVGDEEKIV